MDQLDNLAGQWNFIKSSGDTSNLNSLILELSTLYLKESENTNGLTFEAFSSILQDIYSASTESEWTQYIEELLVDIIWLIDLEIESNSTAISNSENDVNPASFSKSYSSLNSSEMIDKNPFKDVQKNERNSLVEFTKLLTQNGFVSTSMLLERLESEFLQMIGLIGSVDLFNKKIVKLNTAIFYRQQKFNLIREESEGFSKLVLLLTQTTKNDIDTNEEVDVDLLFNRILELIGFFELDPIKVLDIILDTFTFNLEKWNTFTNLLKKFSFPTSTVISLISFKLKYFQTPEQSSKIPFDTLFTMIAILTRNRIFSLEEIWSNLHVTEEESKCLHDKFKADLIETSKKLGVINLNATASSNTNTNTNSNASTSSNAESLTEQFAQDSFTKSLDSLLTTSGNVLNFKAHLLSALLYVGSSDLAFKILQSSPHLAELLPGIPRRICNVLEYLVEIDSKSSTSASTANRFFFANFDLVTQTDSSKWLNWIQYLPIGCLGRSPSLYSKLCRLFSKRPDIFPVGFIQNYLIPAISFGSHDSLIMSQELWYNILSDMPYSERYTFYGSWNDSLLHYKEFIRACSISEARKVMRRLAKENVRQYGRLVAKVTHSNPVIVLPLIIDQIQAYDNIISPVVDAFKFLTPLSFDVLIFCLLKSLSSPERDRLKEDGTNIASWLQNLAQFSASLFRKYYASLDLSPLLKYIYAQLIDDNCLDLVILQDLLTLMTGVDRPENWSEGVIEGMAGGPILLQQVKTSSLQTVQPSRRVINRFKSALESEGLTFPLLIAIAQAADAAIYRMDYSHIKLVSSLVDTCNSALFQYIEVLKLLEIDDLCSSLSGSNRSFLLDLIVKNKLEFSVAFTMARTFKFDFSSLEAAIRAHFSIVSEADVSTVNKVNPVFIPSEFLQIFWNSSLSSISVPLQRYQLEINRAQATNVPLSEQLQIEMKGQVSNCGKYRDVLMKEKDGWFKRSEERNLITDSILKFALLPRLLLTPGDALFSAKFVFLLHSLGPPHLSTLTLLSSIFDTPEKILSSLTETESHCFGRFVQEILVLLQGWHTSREKYEREAIAAHLPGFMKRWSNVLNAELNETEQFSKPSGAESAEKINTPTTILNQTHEREDVEDDCGIELEVEVEASASSSSSYSTDNQIQNVQLDKMSIEEDEDGEIRDELEEESSRETTFKEIMPLQPVTIEHPSPSRSKEEQSELHLNWEDFRHVLFKWHTKLNLTLVKFLKSKNYTSIRNSIIFLSHLSGGTFPKIEKMSDELEEIVGEIREKDGREDLKVLATRYSAMLTQNRPKLVKAHQFHICEPEDESVKEKVRVDYVATSTSKSRDKALDNRSERDQSSSRPSKDKDRGSLMSSELKRSASSNSLDVLQSSEAKRNRTHPSAVEPIPSSSKDRDRDRLRRDDRNRNEKESSRSRNDLWSERRDRDNRDRDSHSSSYCSRDSRDNKDRDVIRDSRDRDTAREARDKDPSSSFRESRDSRDTRDRDRLSRRH